MSDPPPVENHRQPKTIPPPTESKRSIQQPVGAIQESPVITPRPPKTIRPRSFAASPHAVILEQSEESRGATPLEDDTDGAEEGKREKRKEKRRGGYHPPAKQPLTAPDRSVDDKGIF